MMRTAFVLGAWLALSVTGTASSNTLDGNQLLARAASLGGLRSYTVPAHFDVRLHRPLPLRMQIDGSLYYKPPAQSALVITKRPPIIGGLFAKSYDLDLVPQTWPAKYSVRSVTATTANGQPAYALDAVPKIPGPIDHVVFDVLQSDAQPLSAEWFYTDKSTVAVSIASARVDDYVLPEAENITVAMPNYALDATSTLGQYAFGVSIPETIFTTAAK